MSGVRRLATAIGLAWAVVAAGPGAGSAAVAARGAATPQQCGVLFPASYAAQLHRVFPGQRVTASVYDLRTHCWWSLHGRMRITTASVVKAQVMGAVLLLAQDQHRSLSPYEKARIAPMVRWSYNCPDVCELYSHVGGVHGMDRFDRRMHARHTTNTADYGATLTTARDRTEISRRLLVGGGPLRAAGRRTAWQYMSHVTPTQRWGITAGRAAGWTVALKNGFYPMSGHGWRVGSTGVVRGPDGQGYALTVMTDQDVRQVQGVDLVERVARRVATRLSGAPAGGRLVDRARCVTTRSGQSWSTVARQVGLPASRAADVRRVSGGNPSPLQGQRACSPQLQE